MVQALVDADHSGACFMSGGDELGEDRPIQDWSKLVLASRIARDDGQDGADRHRGTVAKQDIVSIPVSGGKRGGGGAPTRCGKKRSKQPDRKSFRRLEGHEQPPKFWSFEPHLY